MIDQNHPRMVVVYKSHPPNIKIHSTPPLYGPNMWLHPLLNHGLWTFMGCVWYTEEGLTYCVLPPVIPMFGIIQNQPKGIKLADRNPSRMLNSGNIFFTILIWFWIRFDDMNLICFEFGVMISIWFWYGFDTILIRFWYDFDMILIRFWYGSSELASKKETETAQG
jgi:hypothetical protein